MLQGGPACSRQTVCFPKKFICNCVLIRCTAWEFITGPIQSQMKTMYVTALPSCPSRSNTKTPCLIWPKLVRRSKAQRNQACIQRERCPNLLLLLSFLNTLLLARVSLLSLFLPQCARGEAPGQRRATGARSGDFSVILKRPEPHMACEASCAQHAMW